MKRKLIWSLVAALTVTCLLGLWFVHNFEQAPSSHWEAAQKEAQRNPYLALEHLFGQLGRPLTRLESPHALDALPAGGALFLDDNRRRNVDAARAGRLLDWVQNGGYLIVAAENVGDDPLLARLGLSRYRAVAAEQCKPAGTDSNADSNADAAPDSPEPPPPKPAKPEKPIPVEVRLPDNDTIYRLHRAGAGLSSSSPEPAWRAGPTENRSDLLHYAWGRGQITVLDNFSFLDNRQIGNLDHAELIWALLQRYQPQGEVRLASRLAIPTLWQWLAESASTLLLSAALLIALWLWRIVPRFGGTLATPAGERRDLAQHLAAIGRSVWREGGIAHWLGVVRRAVHQRLQLRHPYLYRQDTAQQRGALAKIANCTTKDIQLALSAGQAQNPDDFTAAMQTLQRLDERL